MTDLNTLAPSEDPPKKQPLRINLQRSELDTAALGKVLIGHLSVGAMLNVSKLMEQETAASDDQIARTLFQAVARIPPSESGSEERSLSSDELESITDADIEIFANIFNSQQGWSIESSGAEVSSSPVQLLCQKVRNELKQFSDSVNNTFKLSKGLFSKDTRKLISESALIGERLKEFAGASKLAEQLALSSSASLKKAMESISATSMLAAAGKFADVHKNLASSAAGFPLAADYLKKLETSPAISPAIVAPHIFDSSKLMESMRHAEVSSPVARSARALSSLDIKIDEVLEIARSVAELHGKTNEAVLSGLSNLANKWVKDEHTASRNIKWAVTGIFISAAIALFAVSQDFFTNKSNDRQQQETKVLLEEQVRLTKGAAIEQNGHAFELEKRVRELEFALVRQSSNEANSAKKSVSEHK